jgi:hypothetical protein
MSNDKCLHLRGTTLESRRYFEWAFDPNRAASYYSTQQLYKFSGAESAILSEGLAGLAREAEVKDSLGRNRRRSFDALSRHCDHLPLQFFVDHAG